MFNKNATKQGLTYIELLVAIGIIAILSTVSVFYIKRNAREDVRRTTEQLAADIRLIRNMSISRTAYNFGSGVVEYPEDGYGIYFADPTTSGQVSYYILYAGVGEDNFDGGGSPTGDRIIKRVNLSNARIELNDINSSRSDFYFIFLTENSISTDLTKDVQSRYIIEALDPCVITNTNGSCQSGYRGVIRLGEVSGDKYTLSNIGVSYSNVAIPTPPPPPPPDPGNTRSLVPQAGGDQDGE